MATILLTAKRLAHYEVYDRQGTKLGVIDDSMLDISDATVRYAVLACKSSLGHSRKLFAVPLAALALDTENECFVLNVGADELAHSSGFDEATPPELPDPLFGRAGDVSRPRPVAPADGQPT